MQLRDILVVVHGANAGEQRLAITMALAHRHGARVTGFCPLDLLTLPRSEREMAGYGEAVLTEPEVTRPSKAVELAEQIEGVFRSGLTDAGVSGAWYTGEADPAQTLVRLAHHADLVVVGQPDPDNPRAGRIAELIEHLLMQSGRPLLIVPYAGRFDAIGGRVLIGWTETRESARAVHDALPLLTGATSVTALTILEGRRAPGGWRTARGRGGPAPAAPRHQGDRRTHGDRRHRQCRRAAVLCLRHRRRPAGDGRLQPLPAARADGGRGDAVAAAAYDGAGADVALTVAVPRRRSP